MDPSPIKWWLVFTSYDPVVWSYIAYLILLYIADLWFGVAVRVMRVFSQKAKSEDSVFIIAIISNLLFFLTDLHFDNIAGFKGIVDSSDARYDILRWKIIKTFMIVSVGGAPIMGLLCGILAKRKGLRFLKWCVLGSFFNILALSRLLTLNFRTTEPSDGHRAQA